MTREEIIEKLCFTRGELLMELRKSEKGIPLGEILAGISSVELSKALQSRDNSNLFGALMPIIEKVFDVKLTKVLALSREREESLARVCAMSILSKYFTLQKTASVFNRSDHATIISAKRRNEYLLRTNPLYQQRHDKALELFEQKQQQLEQQKYEQ